MDNTQIAIQARLVELERYRQEIIEQLKLKEKTVLAPIDAVISELQAFLPIEEEKLDK